MVEMKAKDFDRALLRAADNGQEEIVRLMLRLGAKCLNHALISAASGGSLWDRYATGSRWC